MAKKASGPVYPLAALRAAALHTQRLITPNQASPAPTPDAIFDLVTALGYVQIDTLHVVNRAHYVTLWARFGSYDLDDFHRLIYTAGQRRLYEGWGHAASIIPLEHYRYHRWRADTSISYNPGFREWLSKNGHRELAAQTLERIRAEGGLRVGDFEYEGPQRGAWYDWKPPKVALEVLFAWGDLMVADRVNFQRVYDVRERVLPEWVDTTPVTPDEARRFCLEQAARALGVFEPRHLTFYAYMRATPARSLVSALIEEGLLVEIRGESMNGVKTWMAHRDNLPLLQQAADGDIRPARTTFLAPFDSLFWAGDRDEKLWGFNQVLECYKPAAERVYGYFSLPILHKDRLVGRFDPKLDRKTGVLNLNALYLEPGIVPDDELVAGVAAALRDFLSWHGAKSLTIEKSDPAAFGEKLMRAL
ncbi:MAG: winged helix-turn-helix domain-containing protein [Chloroflexi bacterium]|nr:winged helix-turn-helix domain-containing protein [Chloroflexota bacterium]MDL1884949.1 winged helix-turn-helix domain-containing protein [Anaerolineae bacterium CFX8]